MWSRAIRDIAMVVAIIALAACGTQTGGVDAAGTDVKRAADGKVADGTVEVPRAEEIVDGKSLHDLEAVGDSAAESSPDTTPPTVKIVAPKDGAFVSGIVGIEVEADDDRAVDRVELSVDGELVGTLTESPYQHDWDAGGLIPGDYEIAAVAYDEVGHSTEHSIVVFVQAPCDENGDCPPKSVKVITPVDGSTVCGELTIEATAQDDNGITEFEFFVDEDSLGVDMESPFQKDWDTTKYDHGEHVVKVVARDSAGHEAFATSTVKVDNTLGVCDNLPSVTIEKPEDGAYLTGEVEITAKASDDIGVLKVQFFVDNALLDEDDKYPYKLVVDTTEFEEGAHTIKVIAYDTADQMGSVQIQITVDHTPPPGTSRSRGAGEVYSGTGIKGVGPR